MLLMDRKKAESLEIKTYARLLSYAVAGVPPGIMGIGPVEAIPKALNLS
ncbi:MAG: 3-ketoacyl-CoA thiolase [Candidatus Scalindua rubra]|uniref:3-ketoacyl-CoA thiolase n=1 Tax=Candidatus Scalindua rubra TaxID=1872076 RepID=A0A1E3XCP8_9BACT|nr:MAG: 3-ketoacyl-CoA thiolase [Candidatus Scalindua rubra]